MQEMELIAVRVEMPANAPMVILRERKQGGRTVPIFIGAPEATAIALALDEVETPRPMTHDLLATVLGELGAQLELVAITELRDKTFFAELHLRRGESVSVVSSRPSDAIALAVRTGSPIHAAEAVIAEVGFVDDDFTEIASVDADRPEEMVEEFKEFLDSITPEDFED